VITDPALPHLATAFDEAAMAALFGELLAAQGGAPLQACRIDRIKYRPRRNLSVSYRLEVRDARSGRAFEQLVSTRWCTGGEAAQRHDKALRRAPRASAAGPALSHLPQYDCCASWLPNDPKLDALVDLLDEERLRTRWLPEVVAALTQGRGRLRAHRTTLVQWVPEHRACARVELDIEQDGALHTHTLFAKADTEHAGATTHAVMQALRSNERLRSAEPILWQPEAGLHWQQAIDGRPLAEGGSELGRDHATQVGALLAALHATPVPTPRRVTPDDLGRQRHEAAHVLGLVEPAWRPVLDRLVRALDRSAPPPSALPTATLHGDLHRVNLLVGADGGLALIDLDGVLQGPAVVELGSWIADSFYLAMLGGKSPGTTAPQWRTMLQAYRESGGPARAGEAQLAWACAQQLLCQRAYRCVVNQKPGRLALVPALLQLACTIASERTLEIVQ